MNRVYVFALTARPIPSFKVHGRHIEFMEVDDLHAAVEHRAEPLPVSESTLRSQHDVVMRIFNRIDAVLPVRFGAWIDPRELTETLLARKTAMHDALGLVRGRVQMTVRFLADQRPIPRQAPAARGRSGTEYLRARRNQERAMPAEADAVRSAVQDLLAAERVSTGSPRAQPSLYHLIDRGSVDRYAAAIAPLHSSTLTVTGPWAAFAFAPDPWE
jgi:hypothetical protein